jgi:endonuclease-3
MANENRPPAKAAEVITRLKKEYPQAHIALNYGNPLELLIATILSAQATDVKVNEVTAKLFKKYRTLDDYADANPAEFEQDIRQTGFYRNKTKNVIRSAQLIRDNFGGQVPGTMVELVTLPGVARKTGNIVLYNAYGVVDGIPVDTHVGRLSQRLGLSANKDPVKIEKDLMLEIPRKEWGGFSYLLIDHGRAICHAQRPKCGGCLLNDICPSAFNF